MTHYCTAIFGSLTSPGENCGLLAPTARGVTRVQWWSTLHQTIFTYASETLDAELGEAWVGEEEERIEKRFTERADPSTTRNLCRPCSKTLRSLNVADARRFEFFFSIKTWRNCTIERRPAEPFSLLSPQRRRSAFEPRCGDTDRRGGGA